MNNEPTFTIDIETKSIEFNINGGARGLQGIKGDTGEPGYTPQKGVDYFTEEDIESLDIPHKTSDLTNDSGFINKDVNDLTYYSTTSEIDTELQGKQDVIDSSNKLDADLVDDSTSTNKFLTNSAQEISGRKTFDEYAFFSNGLWSNSITSIAGSFSIQADDDSNVLTYDGFGTGKPTWQKKVQFYEGATTITPTNDTDVANKKYVDDNIPDLTDYVTNTDYGTNSKAGIIRSANALMISSENGGAFATTYQYSDYTSAGNTLFVSKGTLENVLNNRIGDINTAIDAINGEVI